MPIRVLHFPGIFINGGVETVLMNWYKNIDRTKIQFDFCVSRLEKMPIDVEIEAMGGRVYYMPRIKEAGIIKTILFVRGLLKANPIYKIIHIHSVHAGIVTLFASYISGIKQRIYHVHSTSDLAFQCIKGRYLIERLINFLIVLFTTERLACSREAGIYVYGKAKYKIIHNAVDLKIFKPWSLERRNIQRSLYSFTDEDLVVGYVARFVDGKNQELLVNVAEVAKRNDVKIKFFLVGDGPKFESLKQSVIKRGLTSYFYLPGFIKDTVKAYNAMDIFCIPSCFEGLPMVTIEAQACGLPCLISSGVPIEVNLGISDVIQEKLDSNSSTWLDKIISLKDKRIVDIDYIKNGFIDREYEISSIIRQLELIYKIK